MAIWPVTLAVGFVSGVLSGMFGIGGGIITTPALRVLLDAPALVAVGTPLPVIIPSAITGAITYARRGLADVRSGVTVGLVGAAFAVAGAVLATRVGGRFVLLATAVLILYVAVDMTLQALRPRAEDDSEDATTQLPRPGFGSLAALGVLTGLYSGFLGLGGGFVLVPMLTRWLRFPVKRAIGTSLVAVGLLAVPGTITHYLLGNVNVHMALLLIAGVIPGAFVGARITLRSSDRFVRISFAVLLATVGILLGVSQLGGLR